MIKVKANHFTACLEDQELSTPQKELPFKSKQSHISGNSAAFRIGL
jgi:hypothetical protein